VRKNFFIILVAFWLILSVADVQASWLINAENHHMSVHGQLSCQDCHESVTAKEHHPDPLNVNQSISDFFDKEVCLQCHDTVEDDIEAGEHGGQAVTPWQRFDNCIACHDPHYQLSFTGDIEANDLSLPMDKKCSLCHESQNALPEMYSEDQDCMTCHRQVSAEDDQAAQKIAALCFYCHDADSQMAAMRHLALPLIDKADYADTVHATQSCLTCHPESAGYQHNRQKLGDCRQCHVPHHEKTIHDAHTMVSCGACHLDGVTPSRDRASAKITWIKGKPATRISQIHRMPLPVIDASCRRCHVEQNTIGAAAMLLPPKSVLCMPCHTATFSMGDTITWVSLLVFAIGFLGIASVWFSGAAAHGVKGAGIMTVLGTVSGSLFSNRIGTILKALVLDGFFQRRLYHLSSGRWGLHALVFYPFVFRFAWGAVGLVSSRWWPGSALADIMVNKNHPLTAFVFDFTGFVVVAGVIGMIVRRIKERTNKNIKDQPPSDWLAYSLLGGIMLVGFVLEGMRMAMTGSPASASWAFVGDLISRFVTGFDLIHLYGYVWYLHAILTGAFVAYLPFSRMLHMIMAPVVMAINAGRQKH